MPLHGDLLAVRPRLVVLRALGLGDLLTVVPALRALAAAFPDHHRVMVSGASAAPLATLTGTMSEVVTSPPLAPLPSRLDGADVAVNLHGRGPQSHRLLLATGCRRLVAFGHDDVPGTGDAPRWVPGEHEVLRWCRLLEEEGIPSDPTRLDLPDPGLALPPLLAGATLVHPGAASPARRWPAERWARVAGAELAAGRSVVVTAGPGEEALAARVATRARRVAAGGAGRAPASGLAAGGAGGAPGEPDESLPGWCEHDPCWPLTVARPPDVLWLAALVGAAGRVACGDTGVAHLATALGTPSVVLFGPVPPSAWGPPAGPRHRALWTGRRGSPHARRPHRGLLEITEAEVLQCLDQLGPEQLGEPRPSRTAAASA